MVPLPDPISRSNPASVWLTLRRISLLRSHVRWSLRVTLCRSTRTNLFRRPDRVIWNLEAEAPPQRRNTNQQIRVDPQHTSISPAASEHFADFSCDSAIVQEKPWLVLVENARDVALGKRSQRLREALEQDAQLLIVVCDVGESAKQTPEPAVHRM